MKFVQCIRCTKSCKKENIYELISCNNFDPRVEAGTKRLVNVNVDKLHELFNNGGDNS